ncbi:hypothetical protein FVR03_07340 [Pontibacter qinzhouensis]|uniref:PorV/PorQ family protein n=1 Tax=Pontibacter qinzhouensis TaxID=2603253 RepID=A0A5C8KD58_9BACT|nr:hypothetical protein [Pontibacter qinzhouensis]TXK49021.1 hypothetical protein FVR03_07340 [Pontibacter qinzhouensis]
MDGITLRTSILFLICQLSFPRIGAAQADVPAGARAAAMGNASVTFPGLWALQNNVAGIGQAKSPAAGAYAENRFGLSGFNTVAFLGVYPFEKLGSVGLSMTRFGDELFSRQSLGIGLGHQLGQFSLGAKADVWQVSAQGLGSRKAFTFSVGVQAEVIPDLFFGAYAYNLNQAKVATFEDERLPTVMKAGLAYRPYQKLLLSAETEKDINYPADLKAGIEYKIVEKFALRTGFSAQTSTTSFGAGFLARHLQIDYAFGTTTLLGLSHHLSVSYQFKEGT